MAHAVHGDVGGIRSLLVELRQHGEAINHDLISRGWTRGDIGGRLGWRDLLQFLKWMPPVAESAYFRSRRPNSWWVTPQVQVLAGILYAAEGANWQRGGGQGKPPKPMKFPEDKNEIVMDKEELQARKDMIRRRRG